jgi:putative FmdB family regulatory protein
MARYTYKCSDCGNVFDIEATMQEKEEGKSEKFMCPVCKSKKIKQDFSPVNFLRNVFRADNNVGGCCSGGKSCEDKTSKENKC